MNEKHVQTRADIANTAAQTVKRIVLSLIILKRRLFLKNYQHYNERFLKKTFPAYAFAQSSLQSQNR